MDAITRGTSDGLNIYLSILAILIVLIAFVALANGAIWRSLPDVAGASALTLERIAGWIFAPLAWLMGIPWREALTAGSLLGVKTVLNEFIAYLELAEVSPELLSDRSRLITIYGLCRLRELLQHRHPGQRHRCDGAGAQEAICANLALRAFVGATLASCMCALVIVAA
jgi:CNT family concentrative nucleoside transporter